MAAMWVFCTLCVCLVVLGVLVEGRRKKREETELVNRLKDTCETYQLSCPYCDHVSYSRVKWGQRPAAGPQKQKKRPDPVTGAFFVLPVKGGSVIQQDGRLLFLSKVQGLPEGPVEPFQLDAQAGGGAQHRRILVGQEPPEKERLGQGQPPGGPPQQGPYPLRVLRQAGRAWSGSRVSSPACSPSGVNLRKA